MYSLYRDCIKSHMNKDSSVFELSLLSTHRCKCDRYLIYPFWKNSLWILVPTCCHNYSYKFNYILFHLIWFLSSVYQSWPLSFLKDGLCLAFLHYALLICLLSLWLLLSQLWKLFFNRTIKPSSSEVPPSPPGSTSHLTRHSSICAFYSLILKEAGK